LLLSPIVGEASNEETMMFFVPPGARRLQAKIASGSFPAPLCCQIHVGEDDWQSNPANVAVVANALNIKYSVVPKNGHRLERTYVSELLDAWLSN
jgi:hypothetical protein